MDFDYHINICLSICETTGEAFVGYYGSKVPYEAEKHRVPEKFRKYLNGRGDIFIDYKPNGENGDIFSEFIHIWYDQFPSWKDIDKKRAERNKWTEEDHDNFRALLKWFIANKLNAVVWWSY